LSLAFEILEGLSHFFTRHRISGVASPEFWGTKNLVETKMFNFRRATA